MKKLTFIGKFKLVDFANYHQTEHAKYGENFINIEKPIKYNTEKSEEETEEEFKGCTCKAFQQNEDCEHMGNKVLEEFGLPTEQSDEKAEDVSCPCDCHDKEIVSSEELTESMLHFSNQNYFSIAKYLTEKYTISRKKQEDKFITPEKWARKYGKEKR